MSAGKDYQAIVVGAGHNGLANAAYLAKAGLKVLVLEAGDQVGGLAAAREFVKGYRASTAHLMPALSPRIAKDLKLSIAALPAQTDIIVGRGETVTISPDAQATATSIARQSKNDAENFPKAMARWSRFAHALAGYASRTPPRPDLRQNDWQAKLTLGLFGLSLRRLGRRDMLELTRIIAMNVADLAQESFESDAIKGLLGWEGTIGLALGPKSPSTVFNLLYRMASWRGADIGFHSLPKGGMGALCEAMAEAAKSAGTEIRTSAPVERILIEGDRSVGVRLRSGEEIRAAIVVSNLDPVRTAMDLIGPANLDAQFVHHLRHLRMNGCAAKLHLALDSLPEGWQRLTGRTLLAPSLDYIERAYDGAKYGRVADRPALEMTIPSLTDPSLAPAGRHVVSILAQYAPFKLRDTSQETARQQIRDRVLAELSAFAPDLEKRIVGMEVLTPHDLAQGYGPTGGQWHHGEITLDQVFLLRPAPGFQQYRLPVPGTYLCGAGAHPGGNITGQPGANAAREILKDLKRGGEAS